jgi:hypothetical protein
MAVLEISVVRGLLEAMVGVRRMVITSLQHKMRYRSRRHRAVSFGLTFLPLSSSRVHDQSLCIQNGVMVVAPNTFADGDSRND